MSGPSSDQIRSVPRRGRSRVPFWSSPFGLRSGIDLPEDKDLGIAVRNVIHVRRCASPVPRSPSTAAPGRLFPLDVLPSFPLAPALRCSQSDDRDKSCFL